MLEELTRDAFFRHLDSRFQVKSGDAPAAELRLVEAEEHKSSQRSERFSLIFQGPADAPLAQGTYQFEHDQLGAFDLFIVPVGQDQSGMQYEAVFNRLRR